jgi:hypothetical protein
VSDKHDNKYMRRASTITVMYNYFGHSIFPAIARTWYRWGWTQYKWDAIEPVIEAGISDGTRHARPRTWRNLTLHAAVASPAALLPVPCCACCAVLCRAVRAVHAVHAVRACPRGRW